MWLPAVGAVLFLTVGLVWALSTPPKDPTETHGIRRAAAATRARSAAPRAARRRRGPRRATSAARRTRRST